MTAPSAHRHVYVFNGTPDEVLPRFLTLCQSFHSLLIAAHDIRVFDALNTGKFDTLSFQQARKALGQSHDAILIDLTEGVCASTLAILAGTVRGGGVFALLLPEDNWQALPDQELARYLPWPYTTEQVTSCFKQYLSDAILGRDSPFQPLGKNSHLSPLPNLAILADDSPLTHEQATLQQSLLINETATFVLVAPRGRGKSTLLGDTLAKQVLAGKKVALTAPNQQAIHTVKARFNMLMEQENISYRLPFIAPDALLSEEQHFDILYVDEAATLPIPMLMALYQKASSHFFSTTDFGYEGIGKGFGIRFCQYLEKQKQAPVYLTLEKPIRWGENDPLEQWLNHTLFLSGTSSKRRHYSLSPSITSDYQVLVREDWLAVPDMMGQAFQLLASAHYQTSPDNVRWIMDDPSVSTWLSVKDSRLVSVAIVTEEGNLPDVLSQQVMEGTRRPRGHLVPQSLLAHEGFSDAGTFRYWRISRIATLAEQQHLGHASQLLQYIEHSAQNKCEFLCTSFAATSDVLNLWHKNAYIAVRLGTSKDHASGSYSLMMVKALSPTAQTKAEQWHQHFIEHFILNLLLQYQDMESELVIRILQSGPSHLFPVPKSVRLSAFDQQNIALFIETNRRFDSIRASFFKIIICLILKKTFSPKSDLHKLALTAALGKDTRKEQQTLKLFGKKSLHDALRQLLKNTQ